MIRLRHLIALSRLCVDFWAGIEALLTAEQQRREEGL